MRYPGAKWYPSPISHPDRPETWGIVIHWTAGHKAGDLSALTGGEVDVHFYVTKAGEVYQFVDSDSQAWHAFHTANHFCLGIEHEGSGEPYTLLQLTASAKLAAWLCKKYDIPVKHTDPVSTVGKEWHGLYGHRDLAHIDGNDHWDSVPLQTGWPNYLMAIKSQMGTSLITPPYWDWVAWKLGEGAFKGIPSNPKRRPKNWAPTVPHKYWVDLEAFLKARKG